MKILQTRGQFRFLFLLAGFEVKKKCTFTPKLWSMRIPLILLLLIFNGSAIAQHHFSNMGNAHFGGLGRAGLSIEDIGAAYYNQAGLGSIKNWAADVSVDQRFNLQDLTNLQVAAVKRFGFGTVGVLFSQFGTEIYNEQLYGLVYGRMLSNTVSLGGMLSVLGFNSQAFGSRYTGTVAIGSNVKLNQAFTLSAHVFSPFQVEISSNNEVSTRFRVGVTYKPSKKVSVFAEIDKQLSRQPWEYKLGIMYQVVNALHVQVGFNPNAEFYSLGLRYNVFQKLTLRGAGMVHQVLGVTPAFSLSYGE